VLECHILRERGGQALDLRVSTTPFRLGAAEYTILALTDIANEKRRQAMERIFYHDLLNMAGALQGGVQVMAEADPEMCATLSQAMLRTVTTLVEEIQAQRDLAAAENATLAIHREDLRTAGLIADLAGLYRQHSLAAQRQVVIDRTCQDVTLRSDKRLLTRILGNMVKNALEASAPGQSVTVGCRQIGSEVELWVNNPGLMPEAAKLQVFQRSFSTKGPGRGLGTYSIKLLSEQYLGGSATFSSSAEGGTTFRVRLPQTPAA
jgi:signal transduction histidine kinase